MEDNVYHDEEEESWTAAQASMNKYGAVRRSTKNSATVGPRNAARTRGSTHSATDDVTDQEALKGFVDDPWGRDEPTRRSERRKHVSTTKRALATKHESAGLSTRSLSPPNQISAKYASLARNLRSGQAGEPRTSTNGRAAAATATTSTLSTTAAATIATIATETPNSPITETTSVHTTDSFSSNTSSQDQNGVNFTALARRRNVRSGLLDKAKPVENEPDTAAGNNTNATPAPTSLITETTSVITTDSFSSNTSSQDQNSVNFTALARRRNVRSGLLEKPSENEPDTAAINNTTATAAPTSLITETASVITTDSFSTNTSSQDQNSAKFTSLARRRNVRSGLLGKAKPVENDQTSNTMTDDTVTPTSPTTETASVRTTDSVSTNTSSQDRIGARYTAFARRRNVKSGHVGESKPAENEQASITATVANTPTSPTTETASVHTTNVDSRNTSFQNRIGAKFTALAKRRNVRSDQAGESTLEENDERAADTTTATATPTASTTETGSVDATKGGSSSSNAFAQNRIGAKYAALTKRRNARSGQVTESKTAQDERAAVTTTTNTNTDTSIVTAPTVETTIASESANVSDGVNATENTSAIVSVDATDSGSSITFSQYRVPAEYTPFTANFESDQASEPKMAEDERVLTTTDTNTFTATASPFENVHSNVADGGSSNTFARDRIDAKYAAFAANAESDQVGESKTVENELVLTTTDTNTAIATTSAFTSANATEGVSNNSRTFAQDRIAAKYAAFAMNVGSSQVGESTTNDPAPTTTDTNTSITSATTATSAPISAPTASSAPTSANATEGDSNNSSTFAQDRIAAKYAAFARNVGADQAAGESKTAEEERGAATSATELPSTEEEGDLTVAERIERLQQARRTRQTPGAHHVPRRAPGLPVMSSARRLARRLVGRTNAEPSSDDWYVTQACPVEPEPVLEYATAVEATPWIKETKTKLTFGCFFVVAVATAVSLYLVLRPSKVCPNGAFSSPREALGNEIIDMIDQFQNKASSPRYKALEWIDEHHEEKDLCSSYEIRQKYVAALLYYATNGSGWDDQAGFLNETSVCKWNTGVIGLFCDENDHNITTITLGGNNLVGSIPPEIGYLTDLIVLNFGQNSMTGTIPHQIGNLTRLQVLYINGKITGTIPTQLGDLIELNWLELSDMMLTGNIPHEIGNLKNLMKLELFRNKLNGSIPTSLGKLSKLQHLSVSSNLLTGTIPSELGHLTMLEKLELDNNFLNGTIPLEIDNLVELDSVSMGENNLIGTLPSELCRLSKLSELDLASNSLNGTIPVDMGNLKKLEKLDLSENIFTGTIPAQLGDIASLRNLNLELNELSGTIPMEFGSTESLEYLRLCCNNLTGAFPHQVDSETSFLVVEIFANNVTGNFSSLCKKHLRLKVDCESENDECECCKCMS